MAKPTARKKPPKPEEKSDVAIVPAAPADVSPYVTDTQELVFCDEYMIDFNVERSAVAARYSANVARTHAYMWLKPDGPKPRIYAEIQRRRQRLAIARGFDAEQVRQEWAKLAGFNIFDLLKRDEAGTVLTDTKGLPIIDWSKLTREQAAAINEIGKGGIKFYGKDGILRDIGRHLGMFAKDAPQVTVNLTLEQLVNASFKAEVEGDGK